MNKLNRIGILLGTAAALSLAGCASPTYTTDSVGTVSSSTYSGVGTVQSIELVKEDSRNGIGLGTVAGAVIGGVIGNQVGEGSGNTAATVLGAAGGAYAGNRIENSQRAPVDAYRISLRMDNGEYRTFVQRTDGGLRIGDRAMVSNGVVTRY